jgi:hypothetical protein
VDGARFTPAAVGRAELLARYGLDPARPVILFSGELKPRKCPLDLIAAAGLLVLR